MSASQPRQLAAVMFTDIVGYTALMEADEEAARLARARHRGALESFVPAHHGRLIQYFGDGSLSLFPSAVDAVLAAIAIQRKAQEPEALALRIGIHQGEISFDEQGVYGDAVNVAARIQGLAPAGAVLVSGKVFDEIKNRPTLPAQLLGEYELKHVAKPVQVYALAAAGLRMPEMKNDSAADAGSRSAGTQLPTQRAATGPELIRLLNEAFASEYIIESQLDTAGVGLVFAGRDVMLEKWVAIKVVRPDLTTSGTAERFLREARILASLKHPNIVPVHRAGTVKGYPYYVMDLVVGESLAERLRRGAIAPALALSIGRELLDALSAAHGAGLIHGDVQPRSMLLVGDSVVLSGFGLSGRQPAFVRAAATTEKSQASYRAPEQSVGGLVTVRSDIYAVGVVMYEMLTGRAWQPGTDLQHANWAGVPRRLVYPIRRALSPAPEKRWSSAARFRRALFASQHVPPRIAVGVGSMAVLLGLSWWLLFAGDRSTAAAMAYADLAMLPFRAVDPADSVFAAHLTTMSARYLEDVPRLVMTPIETTQRWWQQAGPAQRTDPALSVRALAADYVVRGFVVPAGDSIEVQLVLVDSLERQIGTGRIGFRVTNSELTAAAKRVALEILRRFPEMSGELLWRGSPSLDFDALVSFLNGEQARYGGSWRRAAEHYLAALERDSLFADARWQLVNVWRWMPGRTPPLRPHLERLAAAGPADLSPLDRLLVKAQLGPAGEERLNSYDLAVELNPRDAYAALLYGEELFHRGPLAGHPPEAATEWLDRAAMLDPNLAPTFELLAWHHTRLGDRANAQRAVQRLKVLFEQPVSDDEVAYVELLEQAYIERFDTAEAIRRRAQIFGAQTPGAIVQLDFALRAGLAFHLPGVQLDLGKQVASQITLDRKFRANGHIAQALAHAALGRGATALVHFDSAALLDPKPQNRLIAAQWRVIPNAVGFDLMPGGELDLGLASLQQLSADSVTAVRALWTLALHSYGSGGYALARRDHERLRVLVADSTAQRLAGILDAIGLAAADSIPEALQVTEPLLAYDAGGEHGDPFARSVLHLARGGWFERLGDLRLAEIARVWAENTDIRPWLGGDVQAAEVDWVFGPYASYLRGMSLIGRSADRPRGCADLARALLYWADSEPGIQKLRATAADRHQAQCSAI